ncbi:MAG: polyphosphate kinase 2 family protein [Melioribacteraceae bacterium]|nr:polyphosphate kinase 2 family protein [Melioribacteraceae bacterium]
MNIQEFQATSSKKFELNSLSTDYNDESVSKESAEKLLKNNIKKIAEYQEMLYAQDKYSLLIIFQAMDAAGKDSTIKNVMSGLDPQGTQVFSFKQPSSEELDHDYLWRINKALPERGRIGIFNRSHYEEVLIVRVHDYVKRQKIPNEFINSNIWKDRFEQIRNFEKHIYQNGTRIIKIFLNISKEEQAKRFIKRLENPSKNWKFSSADLEERKLWDRYMSCYQEAISETSTKYAPWFVVPADKKWYARLVVSEIIIDTLKGMQLHYPEMSSEQKARIEEFKQRLKDE